ncbi:MAG TPA: hypothetical protein VH815_12415, partial [Acidobacteriota bacterium]
GKKDDKDWPGRYDIEKKRFTGFIAQEVEQAAIQCGYDFQAVTKPQNPNGLYSINYSAFVVPLVKAVQEQQTIIDSQQKQIDELKKAVEELRTLVSGSSSVPVKN